MSRIWAIFEEVAYLKHCSFDFTSLYVLTLSTEHWCESRLDFIRIMIGGMVEVA